MYAFEVARTIGLPPTVGVVGSDTRRLKTVLGTSKGTSACCRYHSQAAVPDS
jgi:hypothetical protein